MASHSRYMHSRLSAAVMVNITIKTKCIYTLKIKLFLFKYDLFIVGYMEPSQPASGFQPPPPAADLPAFTPAGTNPLMRRSRAVDPSIAAGAPGYQNYGGQVLSF